MNRRKREQLILNAAICVFANRGYSKTSVSEIISEAQVARGTFYLYFKSKKELFHALMERFLMEILQSVSLINALKGNPSLDLPERFRDLSSQLITILTRNKLLAKIILLDANGLEKDFDAKLSLFYDQLSSIISQNLEQNIQAGIFRPLNSEIVARSMIGSVKEILSLWILREEIELEPTIQGLIDYLLAGLVPPLLDLEKQPTIDSKQILDAINNLH